MEKFRNYMFFENLEQISRDINKLISLDRGVIDKLICNGHDWAAEHMTTAKDDIEEVTNFLLSNVDSAPHSGEIYEGLDTERLKNYMFFENLEQNM